MGQCVYCDQKAGWLSSSHDACVVKVNATADSVRAFVLDAVKAGTLADILIGVETLLNNNHVKREYIQNALIDGLDEGISQFSKNAPVSDDDYNRIIALYEGFGIETTHKHHGKLDTMLSHILWQVSNNCMPTDWPSVFNLRRGEILCYQCEGNAVLAEEKTVTTGRGYGGISIPLGHGMYGHLGESKPQKVSGLMPIDAGALGITTENIYFSGPTATTQISLRNVVRYQSYLDGIGISEAHGAPKVFTLFQDCQFPDGRSLTGCSGYNIGWFLYPLLTALTNRLNG